MKKLSLNKETVTSLNNQEMLSIQGGSSWPCFRAGIATALGAYTVGQDASWWNCGPGGDEDAGGGGGGGATGGCQQDTIDLCNP